MRPRLVQTPPLGDQQHSFSAPIVVTAAQKGSPAYPVNMSLVPPPVVLVHGLWGTEISLQNVEDYLTATSPWQGPGEVVALCYS
jgi:hypothetical protein